LSFFCTYFFDAAGAPVTITACFGLQHPCTSLLLLLWFLLLLVPTLQLLLLFTAELCLLCKEK
jgi:hypothetical protein